ncbi:MAG TPA: hypothetical protein VM598_10270 [Bdellovibrionota bacterium]|nr:hypothetical protein [Bdellovibrionota bacterium]
MLERLSRLPPWARAGLALLGAADLYWMLVVRDFHALDARPWYGLADVAELFASLGEEGRRAYFFQEAWADLSWILTYTLLLLNLARAAALRPLAICLVPAAFDLLETGGIMWLLSSWPELPRGLCWVVVLSSPLKWLSVLVVSLLILRRFALRGAVA